MLLLLAAAFALAIATPSSGASCTASPDLPEFEGSWITVSKDPRADPSVPGFAILFGFGSESPEEVGRGFLVRLSAPGGAALFRGNDPREWAAVVQLLASGTSVIAYTHLDHGRPVDLWTYRPETRRLERSQAPAPTRADAPTEVLCEILGAADVARGVVLTAVTVGRVENGPELRRAISVTRGCR